MTHRHEAAATGSGRVTVVLHTGGLQYATEKAVVERALCKRPGVLAVEANPVAQTATVTYDASRTNLAELWRWVVECGYHCAGQSVPLHVCEPTAEPAPAGAPPHAAHAPAVPEVMAPEEAMGHGGQAGIAIGAGTDVAIETADVVLMRSDPLDVPTALAIGRGTLRKMRQNLGWAIGYNAIALPIAAGVFEPAFGLVLRPEIAALSMSGSSVIVAVNALMLRRLRLPES